MIFKVALDDASLHAFGGDLIRAELLRHVRHLNLDAHCAAGGAVDWDSVELPALHVEGDNETLTARGVLYFTEVSRGGCADTDICEEREVPLAVAVDRATGTAQLLT